MGSRRHLEFIRVGGAVAIPEILRELGADAKSVIDAAGISPEILSDSDNVIPFSALGRLLNNSIEATRCEHIGLLLGQRSLIGSLGYVGLLAQHSPDVRAALDNFVRYLHIHDSRGVAILELIRGTASLGYTIFENSVPSALDIIDCAVATEFNMMRNLCGSSWRPIDVMLPRPKPRSSQPFDSFFEVPVRFGAEHGIIVFAADWLGRTVNGADPLIRGLLEERVRGLDLKASGSLESQLRRLLRTLVLSRRCSLEAVTQLLNMEPRTLARRLEGERISFRALVDEVRYEVARHLLADTSLAMAQIAATLDYSEASAFARAFRRWSGMTPMSWRGAQAGSLIQRSDDGGRL